MAMNEYQLTTSVHYHPYTCIPRFLLDLTKLKTSDEKRLREQTYQLIKNHPDLKHVIRLLHSKEKSLNLHEVSHRYNFDHFLEMVISSIIEKKLTGNYLKKCDLTHAIEIERLIHLIRPNRLSSGPRLSLLFIYLKLSLYESYGDDQNLLLNQFVETISPYLKYVNINIYEPDWMILTLKLLHDSLGKEQLVQKLKNEDSLSQIIAELNSKTRKTIIGSLINYAMSIEEEHILFQDFI